MLGFAVLTPTYVYLITTLGFDMKEYGDAALFLPGRG
jgi:hypothetical protein